MKFRLALAFLITLPAAATTYTLTLTRPANGAMTWSIFTGAMTWPTPTTGVCGDTDTGVKTDCSIPAVPYGCAIGLKGVPKTGYRFRAWSGACTGIPNFVGSNGANCSMAVGGNYTIGASFDNQATLTITQVADANIYGGVEGGTDAPINCGFTGGFMGTKCSAQFTVGTKLSMNGASADGKMIGFSAWTGAACDSRSLAADTGSAMCFFTITNDTTLSLTAIQPWRVGVSTAMGKVNVSIADPYPVGGVASCTSSCTLPMFGTKPAKIEAFAPGGYSFASWSGACAGQGNPCKLNPGAGQTTAAVFKTP